MCSFVKTEEEAIQAINSSVKAVLIVSGKEGSIMIPKLCDGLKPILNLQSIIVFCGEDNKKKFIKNLKKPYKNMVKMVASDF